MHTYANVCTGGCCHSRVATYPTYPVSNTHIYPTVWALRYHAVAPCTRVQCIWNGQWNTRRRIATRVACTFHSYSNCHFILHGITDTAWLHTEIHIYVGIIHHCLCKVHTILYHSFFVIKYWRHYLMYMLGRYFVSQECRENYRSRMKRCECQLRYTERTVTEIRT
jgi:hypothetical protein